MTMSEDANCMLGLDNCEVLAKSIGLPAGITVGFLKLKECPRGQHNIYVIPPY